MQDVYSTFEALPPSEPSEKQKSWKRIAVIFATVGLAIVAIVGVFGLQSSSQLTVKAQTDVQEAGAVKAQTADDKCIPEEEYLPTCTIWPASFWAYDCPPSFKNMETVSCELFGTSTGIEIGEHYRCVCDNPYSSCELHDTCADEGDTSAECESGEWPEVTCKCTEGYHHQHGVCVDYDSCDAHTCTNSGDSGATCKDRAAPSIGFDCTCSDGYGDLGGICEPLDACGIAKGDSSDCLDECGVPNGNSDSCRDDCGMPNGDDTSCLDECGVKFGDNTSCLDECGEINGDNSSCADDCGVPNGDGSSCSCTLSPCDTNAMCDDTVNPRTCTCKAGFEGDGETGNCADIDACIDNPCDSEASCTDNLAPLGNDQSGRTCTCNDGYSGSGEIDGCVVDGSTWSEYGECDAVCGIGSQTRTCNMNALNEPCDGDDVRECDTGVPCPIDGGWSNWGICSKQCDTGSQTRTCNNPAPQHGGADCVGADEQDCNTDACVPCENGAETINDASTYSCTCTPEWYGTHCTEQYDDCPGQSCGDGGYCQDEVRDTLHEEAYTCVCNPGYFKDSPATPKMECSNAAQCPANTDGNTVPEGCPCSAGYHGEPDITATSTDPYYEGECVEDPCMTPAFTSGMDYQTFAPPASGRGVLYDSFTETTTRPGDFAGVFAYEENNCDSGFVSEDTHECCPSDHIAENHGTWLCCDDIVANDSCKDTESIEVPHGTTSSVTPLSGYRCESAETCSLGTFTGHAECFVNICTTPDTAANYNLVEVNLEVPDFQVDATCARYFVARGGDDYQSTYYVEEIAVAVRVCNDEHEAPYTLEGCFSDRDDDGVADMDEDCPDDAEKRNLGKCGCGVVDYTDGLLNCADHEVVGDSIFYAADDTKTVNTTLGSKLWGGKNTRPKLANGFEIVGDFDGTKSTDEGLVSLTSMVFVVRENTIAFSVAGGGDVSVALYNNWDFETGTGDVVREYIPTGETDSREVQWDVSGLLNEAVRLVVTDNDAENFVYFNNFRMFNGSPGCLAEALVISDGRAEDSISIMGDDYLPVNKPTDTRMGLYCREGDSPVGQNGGASLLSGFGSKISTEKLSLHNLPECLLIKKLAGDKYVISIREGLEEYVYSSGYCKDGSDPQLHCIYETENPRCAAIYGGLRELREAPMYCDAEPMEAKCLQIIYDKNCLANDGVYCGQSKTVRGMLKCCDKDGNRDPGLCLTRRRRLNENILLGEDEKVTESLAEECARNCYLNMDGSAEDGDCFAWRIAIDDFTGEQSCELTHRCYRGTHKKVTSGKVQEKQWVLLKDVNPFEGKRKYIKKFFDE